MDNDTSIPNDDTFLASSNGHQQSTPLQPSDKKRVLNDKETIFIETLRDIENGRISQPEDFHPALSGLPRKIADYLLLAMQKNGIEGYWKSSIAIFYDRIGLSDPAPQPLKQESKISAPVGTLLSEVRGKKVRWLWRHRLPLGKLTTLDGDLYLGKSHLALDIAARVSSGQEMSDGTPGIAGGAGVVLIAPDDGLADTIHPRLQRAGADLSRIVSIGTILVTNPRTGDTQQWPFQLPDDIETLMEAIQRVRAKLVVIDPLMAIFSNKETYKDSEVKMALALVQMLIEHVGAVCLIVHHQTKGGGSSSLSRAGGSMAFIATTRSGLMVLKDPIDERKRVLAHVKSSLSAQAASLSFSIVNDKDSGDDRSFIHWQGECTQTLQELLNPPVPVVIQPLLQHAKQS